MTAIAIGLVWWTVVLTTGIFALMEGDWIGKAVAGLLFLASAPLTVLMAARWKSLSLLGDSKTVRFGIRVVSRDELAAISLGPTAKTPAEFWLGVLVMAAAQDLSRKVSFLAGDGRVLLETTDLYGRAQLVKFASFLGVPVVGDRPHGRHDTPNSLESRAK